MKMMKMPSLFGATNPQVPSKPHCPLGFHIFPETRCEDDVGLSYVQSTERSLGRKTT